MSKRTLILLVALLLLQLFLRAHNITRLPVFIDEDNHIRRAAIAYDGDHHPALDSHGKFLLYLWLGIFDLKDRPDALHLARTMIALTSLITSAAIFALCKRLFNSQIGVLAVALYALMPFALFFERMALADPLAGTLGILTAWQSARFALTPTWRRAGRIGVFSALTVAAKLTMAFVVLFPVAAVILLGSYTDWRGLLRTYLPKLVLSGTLFILLWIPTLIPARITNVNETEMDNFILLNMELAETEPPPLLHKLERVWERLDLLTSLPFTLILLIGGLILLYRLPRRVGYVVLCLFLTWLPTILFSQTVQSRYLMSGVPYLVVILAGVIGAGKNTPVPTLPPLAGEGQVSLLLAGERFRERVVPILILLLWALLFALPFAYLAMTAPADLTMPATDEQNYFWDRYSGYGTLEGLEYLQEEIDGETWVAMLVTTCRQFDYYVYPDVRQLCLYQFDHRAPTPRNWTPVIQETLESGKPLYALTDEWTIFDDAFIWEHIAVFPKPEGRQVVTLWRLHLAE